MRITISFICVLSLLIQLQAQSNEAAFRLQLQPGQVYQLEVQNYTHYYPNPNRPEPDQKVLRYLGKTKNSVKYSLAVLERSGNQYKVELVRTFLHTYNSSFNWSVRVGDYSAGKRKRSSPVNPDTVQFEMDDLGTVLNQINPDTVHFGYASPDGYQVEAKVRMPELIRSFQQLISYLHPESMSLGASWKTTNGKRFTFIKEQAGLLHLRDTEGQDLYLDPETNWPRFSETHLHQELPTNVILDKDQLVRGQVNAGQIPTRISGSAPKHKYGSLLLRITPYFQGADSTFLVLVDENGKFDWEAPIEDGMFFQLTDLFGTNFWGYIRPGGNLQLGFQDNGQWSISGKTEQECNYLNQFFESFPRYRQLLEMSKHVDSKYEKNLQQFWLDRQKEAADARQQLFALSDHLDPVFLALQDRQIDYFRAGLLHLNLAFHFTSQFRSESTPPRIPESYREFLENQILYDEPGYSLPAFRALFHLQLQQKMFSAMNNHTGQLLYQPAEPLYYFAQLHYQAYPRYQTAFDLVESVITQSSTLTQADHLYQHFQQTSGRDALNQKLEESYQKMQEIQTPGTTLPDLQLYDETGIPVNIKSLKGKPSVLVIVRGNNYWDKTLIIEDTHKLVPDVQFIFLHLGPAGKGPHTTGANIHHWHAKTNTAAVAHNFLQFTESKHPRVYLFDRSGRLTGTLVTADHYSEKIIPDLKNLQAGPPLLDKQSRQNLLLIFLGLISGGLIIGLLTLLWQNSLRRRESNRRQQVEAQLQAIRSQLNPHFMFNSMSSIQHLIRSGQSDQAQTYLGKLANLLRSSLRHTRENFISLKEELDLVDQYCALEALRFNFSYELEIDRQLDVRSISIPPLLLQPYVENAVLHGIAPLRELGKLKVKISERRRQLWIRIRDNGQGIKASNTVSHRGNGLGLQLNAERLKLVYGNAAEVRIYSPSSNKGNEQESGTEVQIAMPIDV